jgi:hypothetical protein
MRQWMVGPRRAIATVVAAVALGALGVGTVASTSAAPMRHHDASGKVLSTKALALHDQMRALWEAHGTWTERAIVDFVGNLPDTQVVIARLLQNQQDIGNATKPYYGEAAGNQLAALLTGHINAAVAVLKAAQSGDPAAIATAKSAFFANGNQIAEFLHSANPKHWSLAAMQTMMNIHLNQVITLAVDQLQGKYTEAVQLYDVYINHILEMADMLSNGIIEQFPSQFR